MLQGPVLLARLAAMGTVLLVAACVASPPPFTPEMGIARKEAAETFAFGFEQIADKYIDPIAIPRIVLDGMNGIGAIDDRLSVEHAGKNVSVFHRRELVGRFPTPTEDDFNGWGNLTYDIYTAAKAVSDPIKNASMEKIYEAVFAGAVSKLDYPVSHYSGTRESRQIRARRDGFGGIGISYVTADGVTRVTVVATETPASNAGIRPNDIITHVNGQPTNEMDPQQLSEKIRGRVGTTVTLRIDRFPAAKSLEFTLVRTLIAPRTVTTRERDGVLFLTVSGFNQNTASSVSDRIRDAQERHGAGLKGIVLDLRGNLGGLLVQAIRIADLFIESGDIVNTRGRHQASVQHYEAANADLARGLPLVVLIDGRSASASEVLAAALQDQKRALVIGTTSYGKGTVQTVIRLPNDGEMTLTWSRLIAPSGYAFHGLGIHPTVCTSGRGEDSLPQLIASTEVDEERTGRAIFEWRRVAVHDVDGRETLRKSCPAERRDDELEQTLALRLIADRRAYQRLLDYTSLAATRLLPGGQQRQMAQDPTH